MVVYDTDDVNFMVYQPDDDSVMISHFEIDASLRRQGIGSAVVETIKRVYIQNHDVSEVWLSIGGGESAEHFAISNGFQIVNRRTYDDDAECLEGDYGIDAVYRAEWVARDYGQETK